MRNLRPCLLLLAAALFSACSTCKNKAVSKLRSPDAKWDAITFARDCGPGTADTTQVSVVPAKKSLPRHSGNAFVSDTSGGQAPKAEWGGPRAEASWTPEGTLQIRHDPAARVFSCAQKVGTVPVACSPSGS